MSMVVFVGYLLLLAVVCIWGTFLYVQVRKYLIKREIKDYLFSHRLRLNGNNRFIANCSTLQEVFPDKSGYYIYLAWEDLVKDGTIKKMRWMGSG